MSGKKRVLSIVLVVAMFSAFALSGCSGSNSSSTTPASGGAATQPAQTAQSAGGAAAEPAQTGGTEPADNVPAMEPMTIRCASHFAAGSADAHGLVLFQEKITELSGGAIKFDTYWGASLFGADEALEGIGTGVADMGHGLPARTPTKTPMGGSGFYFPFRPQNMLTAYEVGQSLIKTFQPFSEEIAQHNIKLLSVYPTPDMNIISNTPITSHTDLKGLKVAAAGADYNVWESVGAVPVSMASSERYESLQRKVVDASYLSLAGIYADHSFEVAKYFTYTGLGALTTSQVWVNMDFWNSLTEEQQEMFEETMDWAIRENIAYTEQSMEDAAAEMEAAGVTFYTLSDGEKAEWASKMNDLPVEFAESLEAMGLPGWEFVEAYLRACEERGHVWIRDWAQR